MLACSQKPLSIRSNKLTFSLVTFLRFSCGFSVHAASRGQQSVHILANSLLAHAEANIKAHKTNYQINH